MRGGGGGGGSESHQFISFFVEGERVRNNVPPVFDSLTVYVKLREVKWCVV